jgi:Flp pilus assembly protein TadG
LRWLRGTRASAVLEFAIVAPVFLLLLFAIFAAGLNGFYQLLLDDAVREAARQLQIAESASGSGPSFVTAVCKEFGILSSNCAAGLTYNVQTNAPPATFASLVPLSMPGSGKFSNVFPGQLPASNNVLIQVAYPLPFSLPYIGSALTLTGTNSIMAVTTVRMEPYK